MNSNQQMLMRLVCDTLEDAKRVCEDLMHRGIIARTPTEQINIALGIIASDALHALNLRDEQKNVPHRN